jgi:iron complex transport system permease protein
LTLIALIIALGSGSVAVSWTDILNVIVGDGSTTHQQLILDLRLPRALTAFATGAMLALAGVLMQVLLRNPLADPYILGISGGAGVATLCAMLVGVGGFMLTSSAFAGALLAMLLVFGISHGQGSWSPTRLLLTGVVIAMGWGAIISFILAIAPDAQLRGMLFWLMGDLSYSDKPGPGLIILGIGIALCLPLARDLNIMTQGEQQAGALGIEVKPLRYRIYVLASLLTAVAVTQAGSIGFIGLVIPHMLRLMGCYDHRLLIPAAALLGGSLLVLADTLARTILAPQQLPVGVITALLGVPLFLYLLGKNKS